jgi:hypothetical protein
MLITQSVPNVTVYDDTVQGRDLPRLSKVQRDLEVYRSALACPVWVVGLREGS